MAADYSKQLTEQIALLGKVTEYEQALTNIQLGKYGSLTEMQKNDILGKAQTLDLLKQTQEETERYQAFIDEITGKKDLDEYNEKLGWLKTAWEEGAISVEKYKELVDQVSAEHNEKFGEMSEFAKEASAQIQDQFGQTLEDLLSGNFDNIGKNWDSLLRKMVAQAIATNLNEALFGKGIGSGGGLLGGLVSGLFGGLANVGAVNASPVVSGFDFNMGGAYGFGNIGFDGGGYTGPGGKYDPKGIVHAEEGVLNREEIRAIGGEPGFNALRRAIRTGHAIGGMAGRPSLPGSSPAVSAQPNVQVNVINNGQPMQAQTNTRFDGEKMIVDVVLKDLYVNGPISKAMAGAR